MRLDEHEVIALLSRIISCELVVMFLGDCSTASRSTAYFYSSGRYSPLQIFLG